MTCRPPRLLRRRHLVINLQPGLRLFLLRSILPEQIPASVHVHLEPTLIVLHNSLLDMSTSSTNTCTSSKLAHLRYLRMPLCYYTPPPHYDRQPVLSRPIKNSICLNWNYDMLHIRNTIGEKKPRLTKY